MSRQEELGQAVTNSGPVDHPASGLSSTAPTTTTSIWIWAALVVSVIALAGSLLLSLGLGLRACPLCFYQRTFAMSLVAVLGMGLLTGAARGSRLGLLALPLATAGLGVALFHVSLELSGKLECPAGILALGTAPQQSLVLFIVLFAFLLMEVLKGLASQAGHWPALVGSIVLGGLLALGSCTSTPPMPEAPKQPYPKPADVCRPPFRA